MLQRAASNAYSWWWASHIRTKQSKWLDNNLQDMEVKVTYMLKLIDEDADSFAKKAEMYYLKRPELIKFVEESYRAYRALAERYDHISGELHKANNTIATVFPEKVQFAMEDEEDDSSPKAASLDPTKFHKMLPEKPDLGLKAKDLKSPSPLKKSKPKRVSSPLNKDKEDEIDKLQKAILVLQTEKEFFKSSYESGLAKYLEIEKSIMEMQEKVCSLQDEFSAPVVIEDDEAQALMAAIALKSCEDTLVDLQEKQKISLKEAQVESERLKDAKEKLKALKGDCGEFQESQELSEEATEPNSVVKKLEDEVCSLKQERIELQSICENIREHFQKNSGLSVLDLAEKIDELVNKVISLEITVSSQAAQMRRLKLETDELQKHLQSLEEEKLTLIDGSKDLSDKLRQVEEQLQSVQDLGKSVLDDNSKLETNFIEACHSFNALSEKLQSSGQEEEVESKQGEIVLPADSNPDCKEQEDFLALQECKILKDMEDPVDELVVEEAAEQIQEPHPCAEDKDNNGHPNESTQGSEEQEDIEGPQECKIQEDTKATDESVISCNNLVEVAGQIQDNKDEENNGHNEDVHVLDNVSEKFEEPQKGEVAEQIQELDPCNKDEENNGHNKDVNVPDNVSEKLEEPQKDDFASNNSVLVADSHHTQGEQQPQNAEEDSPDWQQLFLDGLEGREKILLSEYTSILRNFKEVKRRLLEAEKKNQDYLFETMAQVRDLKSANAMKDEEIRSLRQTLNFLQTNSTGNSDTHLIELEDAQHQKMETQVGEKTFCFSDSMTETSNLPNSGTLKHQDVESAIAMDRPEEEQAVGNNLSDVNSCEINKPHAASPLEEKFRRDIDELLEENLEFWLRFSSSFHQIQKFQTTTQDFQDQITKLKDKKQEGSVSSIGEQTTNTESTPINKQLRELQTELKVWLEQNVVLKEELQFRFSSLCDIKEEISRVLKEGLENDDIQFTAYQAAKFQGEISNMQQENNKVADELQAGLDHVRSLQIEVEKTLSKLNENFKLSGSGSGLGSGSKTHHHYHFRHFSSRTRIPLRSFLFGVKPKPKKPSLFSCMNPALQKQYSDLASGLPT